MAAFKQGHPKFAGRTKGVRNKSDVARDQLTLHALKAAGMTPEEIDALTPLAVMRLVMALRFKAGDLSVALEAASLAAPYVHPKLTSAEVKVDDRWARLEAMSDEEIEAEIREVEVRIAEARMAEVDVRN